MKYSILLKNIFLRIRILFILFFVGVYSSNINAQCPTENLVENPQDFKWTYHDVTANNPEPYYSGVMEVGEATFFINGETLTTRAYRQPGVSDYSIPGPTITVVPGNKYILQFHNTLPYEPLSPEHNVFKDPNVSNMHTHGLHISGESPGDDVTRSFEGGRGGDFVWDIPADHMGGTYWYHAHHHGSTFLQVSGGLFGMLIVDDGNDGIPSTVAGMEEREMIFGFLDPAAAGTGGDQIMSGTLSPTWTVNGLVNGNICMPANTWQHWRVLLADRAANMKTIEFGPEVEVMLLARDGVWRTVAPRELPDNSLEITGASRADFAIRTTGDSWVSVDGNTIGNIFVDGTTDPTVHPFDTDGTSSWSANRPTYLRDLRGETNVNNEAVSMGARTINGSKYKHNEPTFQLQADQVQEWSLSGAVQHPFHLHVYHVQALRDDNGFEAGEYYDVVSSKMSIRFDLNQGSSTVYEGRTILHCHILSHEDRGAMGWLDVVGGEAPPTFPADGDLATPYSEYYVLDGSPAIPIPPTGLSANALSTSSISMAWSDNSLNEDGFGIERSDDGTNFTFIASVGPDISTYDDNGLSPSTTYYYRVYAYNGVGNSDPSNIASATTNSGTGQVIYVQGITVSRMALNGNRFRADATITIQDSNGPVSGATVTGDFTGPTSGNDSGVTESNGQVILSSRATKNPNGEWCFEVTDVSLAGASYDPGLNVVTQACESGPVYGNIQMGNLTEEIQLTVSPNPFQRETQIIFNVPEQMNVSLEVYSILGNRVDLLTDDEYEAGQYFINWSPSRVGVGIYYLHFKTNGTTIHSKKIILTR